jgi:hypothetical protein
MLYTVYGSVYDRREVYVYARGGREETMVLMMGMI